MQAPPTARVVSGLGSARQAPDEAGFSERQAGLPVLKLDPRTYDRALDCVHCGLCLPACPTYTENGLEADSPRGRIYLMKGLADGKIDPTPSVIEHLDLCLDCRACETACPSGVVYHELIEETRAKLDTPPSRRTWSDRLVETMFFRVFPYPMRLKLAMLPPRLLQRAGMWKPLVGLMQKLLPVKLDKMQQMLPTHGPLWESKLKSFYPAHGDADQPPRATVALLAGCVGSVLFQDINRRTIRLLQRAGCDVVVPPTQQCCGAIHHHAGRHHDAEAFARGNVQALLTDGLTRHGRGEPDYIVSNIAGCGAMFKDYAHLLRDDEALAESARRFSEKARDVSELLVELDLPSVEKPGNKLNRRVTYHDACHLAHAQRVTTPPRRLLSWIEGLEVIPLPESDMCCGAAGTYNLAHPEMARSLAERKIAHIQKTGARICVTGNVGCAMQIQSEADRLGVELHVTHPVSLLYEAYFGDEPA